MRPARKASTLLLALALVACSGSEAASPPSTVAETSPPTTKPSPTSTTEASTTTSSSTTTTTIPADPVMPLTGLPVEDPATAGRPAVVVKVSNDPGARPQSGLDSADIVFEAWGAGPTRFAAVFQSEDAKEGPLAFAQKRKPNFMRK